MATPHEWEEDEEGCEEGDEEGESKHCRFWKSDFYTLSDAESFPVRARPVPLRRGRR